MPLQNNILRYSFYLCSFATDLLVVSLSAGHGQSACPQPSAQRVHICSKKWLSVLKQDMTCLLFILNVFEPHTLSIADGWGLSTSNYSVWYNYQFTHKGTSCVCGVPNYNQWVPTTWTFSSALSCLERDVGVFCILFAFFPPLSPVF